MTLNSLKIQSLQYFKPFNYDDQIDKRLCSDTFEMQ